MLKRPKLFRYPLLVFVMIIIILFFSPFLLSWVTKTTISIQDGDQVRATWLNPSEFLGSSPHLQFQFSQALDPQLVIESFFVEPENIGTWSWLEEDLAVWQPDRPISHGQTIRFGFRAPEVETDLSNSRLKQLHWQATIRAPEVVILKGTDDGKELFKLSPETPMLEVQLTRTDGRIVDFTISNDGEQILFSKQNDQSGIDLWLMDREGGAQSLVLNCGVDRCSSPNWNPVRDEIAFLIEESSSPTSWDLPRPRLLNLVTGAVTPLFKDMEKVGYDPIWSSKGQWVSIWQGSSGGTLILHATSQEVGYTDPFSEDTGCWSPEERYFYYSNVKEEGLPIVSIIYRVDILSGQRTQFTGSDLVNLGYNYYYPACHPAGEGVLAIVQLDPLIPQRELWWIREDGSYQIVYDNLTQIVTQYSWNPHGSQVLFLSDSLTGLEDGAKIGIWEVESPFPHLSISDHVFQANWLP